MEWWSEPELEGLAICPVVTGIGSHPRIVSDEDWVASCFAHVAEVGLAQFLVDILHVSRLVVPDYVFDGEPIPPQNYPPSETKLKIPIANVPYPGDAGWDPKRWTTDMICSMAASMTVVGIYPYPPMIDEILWLQTQVRRINEVGLQQHLVNMLYILKQSYSSDNLPPGFFERDVDEEDEEDDG
jgi:hypothetical protein